jgi:hypothetical protein
LWLRLLKLSIDDKILGDKRLQLTQEARELTLIFGAIVSKFESQKVKFASN